MRLKNYFTTLVCLLVLGFSLQAQPFYAEDFSGGLPAGWTNEDLTSAAGEEVVFQYTTDPAAVAPAALGNTATATFFAPGSSDGYLWANSDRGLGAAPANNHTTQLTTTAIDCSTAGNVFFSMQSLIGVFVLDATTNAILRVSADDGMTWTDFTLFPNLTPAERWSINPFLASANISSVAANEPAVLLQVQWTGGWEYFMAIDDMELTTEDPRPAANMRVNDFAAISSDAWRPATQVEAIGFIADIENVGSEDQTNVVLTMEITDGSNIVFTDNLDYGDMASDQLIENVFFNDQFTPAATPANYTATYSLSYDNVADQGDPDLAEYSFPIIVTEETFSKDNGVTRGVDPAADNSYTYGCVYYVNTDVDDNGNPLFAKDITFGMTNADQLAGENATILLMEWTGDADESFAAEQSEYTIVGFNSYTFTGTEDLDLITIAANEEEPVPVTAGNYYIAAIQFETDDADLRYIMQASEEFDYQAMSFYTDSLDMPRYAGALDVGNEGTMGMTGFGLDIVPIVRLSVGPDLVATEEPTLPEGAVSAFPNPANDYVNVGFDLAEETEGQLYVYDAKGSLVSNIQLGSVSQNRIRLETKDLPNGIYHVRVQTELGVSSLKISVQH